MPKHPQAVIYYNNQYYTGEILKTVTINQYPLPLIRISPKVTKFHINQEPDFIVFVSQVTQEEDKYHYYKDHLNFLNRKNAIISWLKKQIDLGLKGNRDQVVGTPYYDDCKEMIALLETLDLSKD